MHLAPDRAHTRRSVRYGELGEDDLAGDPYPGHHYPGHHDTFSRPVPWTPCDRTLFCRTVDEKVHQSPSCARVLCQDIASALFRTYNRRAARVKEAIGSTHTRRLDGLQGRHVLVVPMPGRGIWGSLEKSHKKSCDSRFARRHPSYWLPGHGTLSPRSLASAGAFRPTSSVDPAGYVGHAPGAAGGG